MTNFMFAVLGSVTFWAVYLVLSMFVATILLKLLAKDAYSYVTDGDRHSDYDSGEYCCVVIAFIIFWQIILAVVVLWALVSKALWPLICKTITSIDKVLPTTKFGKKHRR